MLSSEFLPLLGKSPRFTRIDCVRKLSEFYGDTSVAVNRDIAVAVAKMDMCNCVRKIIRIFIYIFYLEARTTSIWGSCFHYPDGRIIFKQKESSSAPTSLTLKISRQQ